MAACPWLLTGSSTTHNHLVLWPCPETPLLSSAQPWHALLVNGCKGVLRKLATVLVFLNFCTGGILPRLYSGVLDPLYATAVLLHSVKRLERGDNLTPRMLLRKPL